MYFSVMMDEAGDLSHKEQVSIVVRYVNSRYVIQKRLVHIASTVVGQCYDGASNMRVIHAGVQAKAKEFNLGQYTLTVMHIVLTWY